MPLEKTRQREVALTSFLTNAMADSLARANIGMQDDAAIFEVIIFFHLCLEYFE